MRNRAAAMLALILACGLLLQTGCDNSKQEVTQVPTEPVEEPTADPNAEIAVSEAEEPDEENWVSLFDQKTLTGWEAIDDFGGEGEVEIVDGTIRMNFHWKP